MILDVLFTGLVGVIIDATTGAWYTFDENDIGVILQPLSTIEKDSTLNQ